MQKARLENWAVFGVPVSPYTAPELAKVKLEGNVFNHPLLADGQFVITSTVKEVDFKARTATTRYTDYELGKPSEQWIDFLREHAPDEIEKYNLN